MNPTRCLRLLFFSAALAFGCAAAHATPPLAQAGRLSIDGVGKDPVAFASIRLEAAPLPDGTCARLDDSTGEFGALQKWMRGNHSSGALATRPEGTVELPPPRGKGPTVRMRLSHVTIGGYSERGNPDGSNWRLANVTLHCDAIAPLPPAAPAAAAHPAAHG